MSSAPVTRRASKTALAALAMLAAALPGCATAQSLQVQPAQWQFTVTPYIWLPNVNGRLRFDLPPPSGSNVETETGPNSYLKNLQFVAMVSAEARRGDVAAITDLIYLNFGNEDSHVSSVGRGGIVPITRENNAGTRTDLEGWTWLLAGSYTVARSDSATLDVLGGLRLLHLETTLDWFLSSTTNGPGFSFARTGTVSASQTFVDLVVGVRGRWRFGDGRWYVPYYLDAGAGSKSSRTTQALAGIGRAFSWGDVQLSYRYLWYDQSNDRPLQSLRFSGPALGVAFHF
jgi:hypothetical protein